MMTDRTGGPLYMNLEDEMYRVMAALSAGDVPVDFAYYGRMKMKPVMKEI